MAERERQTLRTLDDMRRVKEIDVSTNIAAWWSEEIRRRDAEIARLRALVSECFDLIAQVPDDIQFWADYASDYFQTHHNLDGFFARYTDFLDKHRPAPPEAQGERG